MTFEVTLNQRWRPLLIIQPTEPIRDCDPFARAQILEINSMTKIKNFDRVQ